MTQWRLGPVEEVFPSQDGQVRVVQVSTKGQKLIHPITRLCPLNVAGPGRVRDLDRRAEDPEPLLGGRMDT